MIASQKSVTKEMFGVTTIAKIGITNSRNAYMVVSMASVYLYPNVEMAFVGTTKIVVHVRWIAGCVQNSVATAIVILLKRIVVIVLTVSARSAMFVMAMDARARARTVLKFAEAVNVANI
jgi:hypothetical protein